MGILASTSIVAMLVSRANLDAIARRSLVLDTQVAQLVIKSIAPSTPVFNARAVLVRTIMVGDLEGEESWSR